MTPVVLAVVVALFAAACSGVRAIIRSRRAPEIVPLLAVGDTIDGYCGFCGEGHRAKDCTALDGVEPVIVPTAYGPAGGNGCEGDHDPVPVIVGEHDPLAESAEPVGWLCSKCLASVTADGKGYQGGMSIVAGKISAEHIATSKVTRGRVSMSLGGGHRVEVTEAGDGDWRWQVLNGFNDVLAAGESSLESFDDALRDACRVAGVEPETETVSSPTGSVRTLWKASEPLAWGSRKMFAENASALRRETEWGAGLIVYDPANLGKLKAQLSATVGEIGQIMDRIGHGNGATLTVDDAARIEVLFADGAWLRAAILHEEARSAGATPGLVLTPPTHDYPRH
jgi:hypothetical protein